MEKQDETAVFSNEAFKQKANINKYKNEQNWKLRYAAIVRR